jgi:hypothetical protein
MTEQQSPKRDAHIRMPADLYDEIASEASRLGVTVNALILIALRSAQATGAWKEQS